MSNSIQVPDEHIKPLLEEAKKRIPQKRFDPIKDINLFSILGMEHKEVSAHSAFLYYIFNPFYKHEGDGKIEVDDKNIRLLFDHLKSKNQRVDYPDNPKYINISREVSFAYGRLDFLIVYSDDKGEKEDAIIIELKIWAGEQQNQLERYKKYLTNNGFNKDNIFFLTPSQRDYTTTDYAVNITLKDDIIPVLISICEELRKDSPRYVNVIKQYIETVNRIIGEDNMEGKYRDIIKSTKDIIAADSIIRFREEALTEMLFNFFDKIKEKFAQRLKDEYNNAFESGSCKFLPYRDTVDYLRSYYVSGKSCYPAIMLKLKKEWLKQEFTKLLDNNGDSDYYPCFYVEIDYNMYAGITIKKGDGEPEYYDISSIKNRIKEDFETNNTTNWWADYKYIEINSKRIDFRRYNDPGQGVFRLLDENDLTLSDNNADTIITAIDNIFNEMIARFFDKDKIKNDI